MAGEQIVLSDWQTLTVQSSGPDELVLEARWETSPKPPPLHWHPHQTETFEVLEGELTVELDGASLRVWRAGETLEVLVGTPHRMWNAGPGVARATWRVRPAQRTEEMFRFMAGGRSGLRGLRLLWRFRNEFRLGRPRA